MRRAFLCLLISLGCSLGAELYISPRYTRWEEFESGRRLLRESGLLLGLGLRGDVGFVTGELKLYGGTLRYDGQTQAVEPVQTDTNYGGFSTYVGLWKETGEVGYSERWFFDSAVLSLKLSKGNLYTFGRYLFMFRDAQMQASLEGVPKLRPRRGPSFEVGAGVRGRPLGLEMSYSSTEFKRSAPKPYAGDTSSSPGQ